MENIHLRLCNFCWIVNWLKNRRKNFLVLNHSRNNFIMIDLWIKIYSILFVKLIKSSIVDTRITFKWYRQNWNNIINKIIWNSLLWNSSAVIESNYISTKKLMLRKLIKLLKWCIFNRFFLKSIIFCFLMDLSSSILANTYKGFLLQGMMKILPSKKNSW